MNTFTSKGDGNGEAGDEESVEEMGEIKSLGRVHEFSASFPSIPFSYVDSTDKPLTLT